MQRKIDWSKRKMTDEQIVQMKRILLHFIRTLTYNWCSFLFRAASLFKNISLHFTYVVCFKMFGENPKIVRIYESRKPFGCCILPSS